MMDARIHTALTSCIHAINLCYSLSHYSSDEQKAELVSLGVEIQPQIAALADEPYTGKGLGCGYLGYRGYRTPWADMMYRLRSDSGSHDLTWKDRIQVLFDTAALGADEMLAWTQQVQDESLRGHLLLHIAADLALEGEMARVEQEITPRLPPNMAHRADRVLLMEYARRGDVDGFLRKQKQAKQRQERSSLLEARELLVEQVSASQGIDEALRLCDEAKGFGESYRAKAMLSYAGTVSVNAMSAWIVAHPALFTSAPGLKESLLVRAYVEGPRADHSASDAFDDLLMRVDALDKSLRHGDASLRDWLLLDLGMAAGPGPRRLLCRKKIRSAWVKRELDG